MPTTKSATPMTRTPRSVGTSADEAFDRLLAEATAIATRIAHELADGAFPEGLDWGHVGDMAETVQGLRAVSDRMFAEGEHAAMRCESGWTGERCSLPLDHHGPHDET
jgi:hypothetical protein